MRFSPQVLAFLLAAVLSAMWFAFGFFVGVSTANVFSLPTRYDPSSRLPPMLPEIDKLCGPRSHDDTHNGTVTAARRAKRSIRASPFSALSSAFKHWPDHMIAGRELFSAHPVGRHECLLLCVLMRRYGCVAVTFRSNGDACYLHSQFFPLIRSRDVEAAIFNTSTTTVPQVDDERAAAALKAVQQTSQELNQTLRNTFSRFASSDTLPHVSYDAMLMLGAVREEQCIVVCAALKQCRAAVYLKTGLPYGDGKPRCYLKKLSGVPIPNKPGSTTYILNAAPESWVAPTVAFGVLTGPQFLGTRMPTALLTWLRHEQSAVFIEEEYLSHAEIVVEAVRRRLAHPLRCTAVGLKEPSGVTERSFNGAWKDLHVMHYIILHFPDVQWYSIVDDDSFVIQQNLRAILSLSYPDPDEKPHFVGAVFSTGLPPPDDVLFAQGGAGIFFSAAAAMRALPLLETNDSQASCFSVCQQWAGDIRVGCCFHRVKIEPVWERAFWSQTVFQSLIRDQRPTLCPFPVSFHNMRNETWVTDLQFAVDTLLQDMNATYPGNNTQWIRWDALMYHYRTVWANRYEEHLYVDR